MSSKTRILAFAVAFAMIAGFGLAAKADVTGSFTTSIDVTPTNTDTEVSTLAFDLENELNLTVVISGLSTSLHSHFGIAGVEDVQLSYAATLGALDINGQFVFGRFAGICEFPGPAIGVNACFNSDALDPDADAVLNNIRPVNQEMLFIKKRVKTSISLGGVSFENLALFEDVNFPETVAPVNHPRQSQTFAFGDVITLSGQTPSGVSIEASTGICASRTPNTIKKHSWPYEVNPVCAGEGLFVQKTNFFPEGDSGFTRTRDHSDRLKVTESLSEASGDGDSLIEEGETWDKTYTFDVSPSGTTLKIDEVRTDGPFDPAVTATANSCDDLAGTEVSDGTSCTVTFDFGAGWGPGDVPESDPSADKDSMGRDSFIIAFIHDKDVVKPNLAFDFETLNISGVPVASGVTASAEVVCVQTFACSMTSTFNFSGMGPIPFTVDLQFQDVFTFDFDGAELTFSSGAGTLTVEVLEDGTIGSTEVDLSTTLNPDTNPATFNVNATMVPGVGLTSATTSLSVERSNVTFDITANFNNNLGGDQATFSDVTFGLSTAVGPVDVSTRATFGAFGFTSSSSTFTINF